MMAMSYGNVYVAQVAMGASDMQTLKAFLEAEAYDGPSSSSLTAIASRTATTWCTAWISRKPRCSSGYWPLFRYNPDLVKLGKNPFQFDSRAALAAARRNTSTTKLVTPCWPKRSGELPSIC